MSFPLFASSQYLLTLNGYHYCVNSYSLRDNSSIIDFVLSSNNKKYSYALSVSDFVPGYDYNASTGTCNKIKPLKSLGLTFFQYNFLMSFVGLLVGFLVLFYMLFIVVNV